MKSTAHEWQKRYLVLLYTFTKTPEVYSETRKLITSSKSVSKEQMVKVLNALAIKYDLPDPCFLAAVYYFTEHGNLDVNKLLQLIQPITVSSDNDRITITFDKKVKKEELISFIRLKGDEYLAQDNKRLHKQKTFLYEKGKHLKLNKDMSLKEIQDAIYQEHDVLLESSNLSRHINS